MKETTLPVEAREDDQLRARARAKVIPQAANLTTYLDREMEPGGLDRGAGFKSLSALRKGTMGLLFEPIPAKGAWGVALSVLIPVPLFLLAFLGLRGPVVIASAFGAMGIFLFSFMLCLTISSRRMSYEVRNKEIAINFRLGGLRIPYAAISFVGLSRVTLILRIFGGSWPGFHWGVFEEKRLGRVRVYSTRAIGDLVLIRLVNGDRIVISPREPERFLEAVRAQADSFGQMKSEDLDSYYVSRRSVYLQVLVVAAVYAGFLAYVLWVYPSLPEVMPVHSGLDGKPDRWGHKSELLAVPVIAAFFPLLHAVLALKFGRYDKALTIFLSIILTGVILLFWGILVNSFNSV